MPIDAFVSTTTFASRVRHLPPWGQLLLFGGAVTLLGCLGALIRPTDEPTALWWPAAGIAVAGLLLAHRRQRLPVVSVLVLAGTLSSLYGGRPLLVAALFALVNTIGAIVVVVVVSHRRPDPRRLHDLTDLMRVLAAVLAGALAAGVTAGLVASGLLGGGLVESTASIAASHASAVLLTLPFVLRTSSAPVEATRVELALQWSATVAVTALVFAPGQRLPLVFLLLPVLLWAALRSSVRATTLQLLTMGMLCSLLTVRGGGPFAAVGTVASDRITIALMQALLITSASVMLAVLVAVSLRRELLLDTSRREELFRVGFTESLLGLLLLRAEAAGLRIVELNGVAARLLDGRAAELIGTLWCEAFAPPDRERVREAVATMAWGQTEGWHREMRMTSGSGERWVEVSISPAVEGTAAGDLLTVQMVDVTTRRAAEARLADLALRDGLTGLANRVLLDDRLALALTEAARTQLAVGVMFLDLDKFKMINDSYGHATGDQVLVEVGTRLLSAVRDSDTVARIGGDEFVIVCPNLAGVEAFDELRQRVGVAVSAPITVDGRATCLETSIGVALGRAGSDARELMRCADADMYTRKAAARAGAAGEARREGLEPSTF